MLTQFHLKGKYFSNRGVRLKQLDFDTVQENLVSAAKLAGKDAIPYEIKKREYNNGIKLFVTAITEPVAALTDDVKWRRVDFAYLEEHFAEIFTAKDFEVLERFYRDFHDADPNEIEDIVGKAVAVSED